MRQTLHVGTAKAGPGEKVWGQLPIPSRMEDQLKPPYVVAVNGPTDGPLVYIGAGTHGDELNSIEATRRMALSIDPRAVHGAVVFVPNHNVAAFHTQTRRSPSDDKNLDDCYPGDPNGSPTDVLAHLIFQEVRRADYALDLHTATRGGWNQTHALIAPEPVEISAQASKLPRMFGARIIVKLEAPPPGGRLGERMGSSLDNNLFAQATKHGVPATIIEFGEGGRLEPDRVEIGMRGIDNVLKGLGVLDGEPAPEPEPFVARESVAIRCHTQGLLYLDVKAGDRVRKDQVLARIISFPDEVEEIRSFSDGVAVRVATDGVVTANERIVVLAVE